LNRSLNYLLKLFLIASGGALGAALRYGILVLNPYGAEMSAWIIMIENIAGSFLLGLLVGTIRVGRVKSWPWSPLLATGVLGSFTTFSTYTLDILSLYDESLILLLFYGAGSPVFGLSAAMLGLMAGSWLRTKNRGHSV
jgi:CrcB protein